VKESTSALPKTTTLNHEGKLTRARFTYSSSTSPLLKTTLNHEGNLMYARFPSIMKEITRTCKSPTTTLHHEGKNKCIAKKTSQYEQKLMYSSFPFSTSTSALPKITLHPEGNITHTKCCCFVKKNTSINALPIATLHHKGKLSCASSP
jgi:hypothetical protein